MNFNLVSDIKVTLKYNHERFDPIKHVSYLKRIFNMQLQLSMTETRCRYHIDYIVACVAEDVSRSFLWKRSNLLTYVELLSLFQGHSYFCCIIRRNEKIAPVF